MIHLYQNNGYNIVLDVNSGAVHVVDKAAYDVIGALEEQNELQTRETHKSPATAAYSAAARAAYSAPATAPRSAPEKAPVPRRRRACWL